MLSESTGKRLTTAQTLYQLFHGVVPMLSGL